MSILALNVFYILKMFEKILLGYTEIISNYIDLLKLRLLKCCPFLKKFIKMSKEYRLK